jgi:nifR3 family TIM-barrel protein
MWKIKDVEINSPIVLAPMAGFTDLPFRKLCVEMGAGLVYTEMISAMAIHYNSNKTFKMLDIDSHEHPIAVQIFGGELDALIETVKYLNEIDCDIIDINMGCPVNKVLASNAGSKWLLDPQKSFLMMQEIVRVAKKPVTCKMRIGWDNQHKNYLEYALLMEKAGVAMLAVHGRTKSQMYSGNVDYQAIKEIKEHLHIPVVANGDIKSYKEAYEVLAFTKCDGVMIGRAALGNPYIFTKQIEISLEDKLQILYKLGQELVNYYKDEESAMHRLRAQSVMFIKGYTNANEFKVRFVNMNTLNDLLSIINDYLNYGKINKKEG